MNTIRFFILFLAKYLSATFYQFEEKWLSDTRREQWDNVKLIVFLNHTSLFEPLFIRLAPNHFLWQLAQKLVAPGADITLNRPITGKLYKALVPGVIPISRKRDETWQEFMSLVGDEKITAILPEGRMKRKNGLDKDGKPMTVRGGIAEILHKLQQGQMLFVYSGGLHHIQAPGEHWPRLFKRVRANLEMIDIASYKKAFTQENFDAFKAQVVNDMQHRLEKCTP